MLTKLPHKLLFSHTTNFKFEDTITLDLLDIFATIFIHDVETKRKGNTSIHIKIPVNNIDIWNKLKYEIEKLINFMTNHVDNWSIEFNEHHSAKTITNPSLFYSNDLIEPSKVVLFSGGLDSFAGISNDLRILPSHLFLTGYKINNHEYNRQTILYRDFFSKIDSSIQKVILSMKGIRKGEPTQRTRSLLFFSIGITMAMIYQKKVIYLFENGIMSLNPEINHSRHTTKTTHPLTIRLFNSILRKAGINCMVSHPYMYRTKGEMLSMVPTDHLPHIRNTISCGMSRQNTHFNTSKKQCGACVPCLLRKISLSKLDYESYDTSYDIPYEQKFSDSHALQNEYKSSIMYFLDLMNSIKEKSIYNVLDLRADNYYDSDWFSMTEQMLHKFSIEVENFLKKFSIFD